MMVPIWNTLAYRFHCIENDFFVHFVWLLNKSAAEPPASPFVNLLRGSIRFRKKLWEQTKSHFRLMMLRIRQLSWRKKAWTLKP